MSVISMPPVPLPKKQSKQKNYISDANENKDILIIARLKHVFSRLHDTIAASGNP